MLSKEAQVKINGIVQELIEGKRNVEFIADGWAKPYYTPTLTVDVEEFRNLGVTTPSVATLIIRKAIEIVLADNISNLVGWFFNAFENKRLAHANEIEKFEMPLSEMVKPVQRKQKSEEEALAEAMKTGYNQELRRYIVDCDECGCDIVIERIKPDGSKFKSTWHTWH